MDMKKLFLILAAALCFTFAANAQSKALGVRIGTGMELSYQHYVNPSSADFLEFDLGLNGWRGGFSADGIWNFSIAQPSWSSEGTWGFYGGPGVSVAAIRDADDHGTILHLGILGNLGLEYTFDSIPLNLSLDVRPRILVGNGEVYTNGIFSFGLGVRYAF